MDRKAKFGMMCSMSSSVFSLSKRAVRRAYPEFGELDMKIKFIGLNYGRKVAREYADYMKKNKNEQSVRH
jgi:hypothetical protein